MTGAGPRRPSAESRRILLTGVGLPGHVNSLVPLAWAARARGHDVVLAVPADFADRAVATGLPVAVCGDSDAFAADADRARLADAPSTRERGRHFGEIAVGKVDPLSRLVGSWRPDLVVSERAEFAGPLVAARSGVPHVELRWSVSRLPGYRDGATEVVRERGVAPGLPAPRAVVATWPAALRPADTGQHHGMRHVSYDGPGTWPAWMLGRRRRRRVCLTLGTVLPHSRRHPVTRALLDLAERLGRRSVEVVVAVEDHVARRWGELPDSVLHAGRFPLSVALRQCDAVVHHGGHGTSLAALETALPQVLVPHFDDQIDNADVIAKADAGIRLLPEELTSRRIDEALHEVLEDDAYAAGAARIASSMAAEPAVTSVVDQLSRLCRAADTGAGEEKTSSTGHADDGT